MNDYDQSEIERLAAGRWLERERYAASQRDTAAAEREREARRLGPLVISLIFVIGIWIGTLLP